MLLHLCGCRHCYSADGLGYPANVGLGAFAKGRYTHKILREASEDHCCDAVVALQQW